MRLVRPEMPSIIRTSVIAARWRVRVLRTSAAATHAENPDPKAKGGLGVAKHYSERFAANHIRSGIRYAIHSTPVGVSTTLPRLGPNSPRRILCSATLRGLDYTCPVRWG